MEAQGKGQTVEGESSTSGYTSQLFAAIVC